MRRARAGHINIICSGQTKHQNPLDFLKPFLKGQILRSGEFERGKFDFDHHFAFLTNFLKRFLLGGI